MSILAERYASAQMREIWSREKKVLLERELWILIMKEQSRHGFPIPKSAINAYEGVKSKIDFASIDKRESILKHDVKARIEEFNALAGYEYIHLGLTSRDVTDNVELFQMKQSLELIHFKSLALLARLAEKAENFAEVPIVGRTHNIPAQVTTLGKRFSMWAEELIFALENLDNFKSRLPLRGIKGALGTASDQIELLGEMPADIDLTLGNEWEFKRFLAATGQVYHRSIDFDFTSSLFLISVAPSNIALNIRLMSGLDLVKEGFGKNQVGSSAMPHKINPRLSERVNSLVAILRGFLTMSAEISGNTWNEGDVSCSAVRRILLSDSAFVVDGVLDSTIQIIDNLEVDLKNISKELENYLPILSTSRILMLAVSRGARRESAHALIQEIARGWQQNSGFRTSIDLFESIVNERNLKIEMGDLMEITSNPLALAGDAPKQSQEIARKIRRMGKIEESRAYAARVWN